VGYDNGDGLIFLTLVLHVLKYTHIGRPVSIIRDICHLLLPLVFHQKFFDIMVNIIVNIAG
jgi:hypothetical protein